MMKKEYIHYNFIEKINDFIIHRELLGNKYIIMFLENGSFTSVHFTPDRNGGFTITLVYKNKTNYRAKRYVDKYYKNYKLINAIQQTIKKHE
jgi:hypothetical protein